MDVLELPRPVINFLRTMAKESCRYALSWDIFGGPDSVTLTLTWKLIDDEVQSSMINETLSSPPSSSLLKQQQQQQQQQIYDNPRIRSTIKDSNRPLSPRRSRRDENTSMNENISVPAIFRSARGKSLEGSSIHSNKQIIPHHQHNIKEQQQQQQQPSQQQHISSLERPTITNHHHQRRTKKEQQKQIPTQSDQIYGNIADTRSTSVAKCATISSLSSSSPSPQPNINNNNNNPPLSVAHTHHQRTKQQQQQQQQSSITPPTTRKPIRSLMNTSRTPPIPVTSNTSSTYAKLRRNNNVTTHDNNNDDDDETLDPWVKRFECSFEDNDDETTEQSEDKEPISTTTGNIDDLGNTSGKVKFKAKPDYF
ncbi:unnamed protein product [Rotaria sp. Silwood1]|nr:unnamed protein product [Rotaria sp. Silwood1]CAF1006125.1 unnamed protein product [Rotaria sp. Silwood1]CAF3421964.1 unnamed protein product [Rotaria sp. Silwood1]CAF4510989.1 unnamed protein product [Rotaria sp. Silwood1]